MKKYILSLLTFSLLFTNGVVLAQQAVAPLGEEVVYAGTDGVMQKGYVAYNKNTKGKRPAIVVVHEWWGSNAYVRMRADMLAQLGYIVIAVDMYGDGKQGANPGEAMALATPFYKDPQLGKARLEAALTKIKSYPETDPAKIAAIGYCFGGSMVLNAAKLGMDLKGVVSFHGGLAGVPAQPGVTKAKILVCNGAADGFVPAADIKNFKENLDAQKVDYTFIDYADATHAFTNPASTETGAKFKMPISYNEAADKKSWEDMKAFFKKIF